MMTGLTLTGFENVLIELDKANPVFGICTDFIVNFELHSLVRYVGASANVFVGKDYEEIARGCFSYDSKIRRMTFERGSRLSVFGLAAFEMCVNLESIYIVASVETIRGRCFLNCRNLQTVTFEPGSRVSVLDFRAFQECRMLRSICIPSSVTTIGQECFRLCPSLRTVEVEEGSRLASVAPSAFSECSRSLSLPPALGGCL
jgi:hypothetical protein